MPNTKYTSPYLSPSPPDSAPKDFYCVNCWAARDVSEDGKHCLKCGSASIIESSLVAHVLEEVSA